MKNKKLSLNILLLPTVEEDFDFLKKNIHFYFQEIMSLLEVQLYEKVQSYYNKYIDIELEKSRSNHEVFEILKGRTSATSRARNYEMFLVSYPSLSEHVT